MAPRRIHDGGLYYMVSNRKHYILISYLMSSLFFIAGCSPTVLNPPSVQPYLNKECFLERKMYLYQGASGIWGGLPGLLNGPSYFLTYEEYGENSIFGKPLSIIPAGTKYSFYSYEVNRIEGYQYTRVKILEGEFSGKIAEFDQDALLKCLNLKMVKNKYNHDISPLASSVGTL